MKISKLPIRLHASAKAVIALFLNLPGESRASNLVQRVKSLTENEVRNCLEKLTSDFAGRHRNIRQIFLDHLARIEGDPDFNLSLFTEERKLLLGAFFTKEYSIQAAALFNPSIVPHPDQEGLKSGELRFVMSLRATGEGHISSIVFQTGIFDKQGKIILDPPSKYFTRLLRKPDAVQVDGREMDYELEDSSKLPLNEKVIFPSAKSESMGMEDLRLVKFEDLGEACYYGTYTAYDGRQIQTKLIETRDFNQFSIRTLHGPAIQDKGMALFPEKLDGKYAMISRQGGEKIQIMFSNDLYYWEDFQLLMEPKFDWELLQLGNCGSPIKTEKGWLLLTHGVGVLRTYVISAILLDLDNPAKIIGRLNKPLIMANESEREGYVPNVVYTCGFMLHAGLLLIPYAMSDSATGFVTIVLEDLLKEFKL